jgi:predicted permease
MTRNWFRPWRRAQRDEELAAELESFLAEETAVRTASGLAPDEARLAARRKLGSPLRVREAIHEADGLRFFDAVWQDLRFGVRQMRRKPAFTLIAVLSLAIGIGANSTVFTVVNAVMFAPLPIAEPERVLFVQSSNTTQSFPNYRDLRDRTRTFAGLASYRIAAMDVETSDGPRRAWGYLATGNYFELLGITPAFGRLFDSSHDRAGDPTRVVVVSYNYWQRQLGSRPEAIGETIHVNRQAYTLLGVAPPGFIGTELFYGADIWVPMGLQPEIEPGLSWLEARGSFNALVVGRLKDGVTISQAQDDLKAIAAALERQYPEANRDVKVFATRPGLLGDELGQPVRMFALGILGLAALVLLVGCANLASMLLAQGSDRYRELALRISIGATRKRLVRQLLTEALLLATAGGAMGGLLATLLTAALRSWRLPVEVPLQFAVQSDGRVFLFTLAVSVLTAILFGLLPAQRVSRLDPHAVLKGGGSGDRRARSMLRDLLVGMQVALGFVVVVACVLSVQGLRRAATAPLGVEPEGLGIVRIDLSLAGYDQSQGREFQRRALERILQLPGVQDAAFANALPLTTDQSSTDVIAERDLATTSRAVSAAYYHVSPQFFRTLGTPLLAGRDFDSRDNPASAFVAIVNETFVRQVMHVNRPNDAIGARFHRGRAGRPIEIVGVVRDGKYLIASEAPRAVVFWPVLQRYAASTTIIARSNRDEADLLADMQRAVAGLDPRLPIYGAVGDQLLVIPLFPNRMAATALSVFGLLVVVLAASGIYGLVAYTVARRQREIGIRVAIGATRRDVLRLVLSRMTIVLIAGASIGLVLALMVGGLLTSVIYEISPRDPVTLVTVAVGILVVGVVASWLPAQRALGIDPASALRTE